MAAKKKVTDLSPEVLAAIRADALSGQSWAAGGPTCRCGVPRKPSGLSKHVNDDGKCTVHPNKPPEPYVPGAEGK